MHNSTSTLRAKLKALGGCTRSSTINGDGWGHTLKHAGCAVSNDHSSIWNDDVTGIGSKRHVVARRIGIGIGDIRRNKPLTPVAKRRKASRVRVRGRVRVRVRVENEENPKSKNDSIL